MCAQAAKALVDLRVFYMTDFVIIVFVSPKHTCLFLTCLFNPRWLNDILSLSARELKPVK